MDYLGVTRGELEQAGGYWTAREISQQPEVWVAIEHLMTDRAASLREFLEPLLRRPGLRVVLTGAGTSSFIGECLAPALNRLGLTAAAVSTTDLVASPHSWLKKHEPTLLVSFARSGNSPESVAAVTVASQAVSECHHLIVTCNGEGALNKNAQGSRNAHVLVLPEETNDRGFAMTSSFSGMLLSAAIAFGLLREAQAAVFAKWARQVLAASVPLAAALAGERFARVVFLGSNEFKGLAREASLKMLELSDGKVVTLAETPLGFRHGPKTIVNANTLVVMFLSNEPYTRRYELDVLKELRADGVAARVVALDAAGKLAAEDRFALSGADAASDLALCLPYAVFAQVLAFTQSMALKLKPDLPNTQGVVNRVVQGFEIYPWDPAR